MLPLESEVASQDGKMPLAEAHRLLMSELARAVFSYAREEASGGPFEKGRRKCVAISDGDA